MYKKHIPFLFEAAAVLATFVHPNHRVHLCSWGFTLLPPTCKSKRLVITWLPFIEEADYPAILLHFCKRDKR
ncbi:hypothetical protein DLR72_06365 [Vibrio paracholerae]|uniref:Secreted protein n=1 Tax=Vibrio paracholerae TaxID=650003 RepID=A0ABD7FWR4_9VIBR|nr:hypothetical protein DLR72_06365 [Vibrio paracholerae]